MEVRRVTAGDGRLLADVRMAALADAPAAFGSTLEAAVRLSPAEWDERALAAAGGPERTSILAVDGGRAVAMAGAYTPGDARSVRHLVGMWVAPAARGHGLGRRLVGEVVAWAASTGARRVELWVVSGNDPAVALYRACGFEPTGAAQTHPNDACATEVAMALALPQTAG